MAEKNNPWDDAGEPEKNGTWSSKAAAAEKIIRIDAVKVAKGSGGWDFNLWIIVVLIVLAWLSTGFYQVQTNEQGVVLRFGKYQETTDAGLHYHLPYPVETVTKVNITQERSINLGSQEAYNASNSASLSNSRNSDTYADKLRSFTESHMLTGDGNIVDINMDIVWKIKDAKDYLFNIRNPDQTVRIAAQSVLREIVGQSEMQPIITGDRGKVEDETKEELQKLLDNFGSGITIVRVKLQKADPPKQVVDAFNEVQRAKADLESYKNKAEAYRNEVVPKAHGEASRIIQEAEAYEAAVINKAQGDAERFLSVYNAYKNGRDVTTKRLYIETMENVLQNSDKVILDPSSKGGNVLPYLPLKAAKQ